MICNSCQHPIDERFSFCTFCGEPVTPVPNTTAPAPSIPLPVQPAAPITQPTDPVPAPPVAPPPPMMGTVYPPPVQYLPCQPAPMYSPDFVSQTLRRLGKSGIFKAAFILLCLHFLCCLCNSVLPFLTGFDFAQILPGMYSNDPMFSSMFHSPEFSLLMHIVSGLSLVAPFLLMVSFLKLSSAARDPGGSFAGGTSMLHISSIVSCIVTIVSVTISMVGSFYIVERLFSDYTGYGYGAEPLALLSASDMDSVMTTAYIIVGIIMFFFLLIYVLINAFGIAGLRNIKRSARTGIPNARYCTYLAVVLFISAGFIALSLLSSLSTGLGNGFTPYTLLGNISSLISGVLNLLFGILLCKYSSTVRTGILPYPEMVM